MSMLSYWTIAALVLGLAAFAPGIMGIFGLGGNKFLVKGKTVLLTGASEGMGKSVAIQLAKKGASVIIVARNVEKLEKAMVEIKAAALSPPTQSFHYISADVSIPTEAARILEEATKFNSSSPPDIVWHFYPRLLPRYDSPETSHTNGHKLLVLCRHGSLRFEILALHPNAEKKDRHLIFTSSVLAFYSVVGYTPYSPTKAAIKSLSDTLYQEVLLYPNPPQIHTIFPGTIASPGLEIENQGKPEITHLLEETDPIQTPDEVARNAIRGLERGEYLITVGWLGSMMRACAWGGSRRGNWVLDTLVTWGTSVVWGFVGMDLDGKVRRWGEAKGFKRN
ncbi:putative 3-ketodihydrosphingosine reductase tsc10 protein [Botrytis fragariae]|uniref:Putative 3-ketodihydrosphingosine reductase tsc10 protein n=1 Tax=Botrytis fragariae TaxID=1964551 RepID=A0A8H6AYE2_9HELO|nr:putative 3-ketodihydrosphingosine reductase tsc10 protein [Botrytis fragariae]KAF5875797.1 putative 3-ketodihydrosphingosine reductase tsc10 protein [Botrytis fragariae]